MMTDEQVLRKAIEKEIEMMIGQSKPEVKNRFVFRFSDEYLEDNKRAVLANIALGLKPPVITFFSKTISERFKSQLRETLNHEIIHTFTKDERVAYGKQGKVNFLK